VSTAAATTSHVGQESLELSRPINELVLAYLAHHGYAKTARAFKSQCDRRSALFPTQSVAPPVEDLTMETETDGDDMTPSATSLGAATTSHSAEAAKIEWGLGAGTTIMQSDTIRRQKIVHSIVEGDIDTALEETRSDYPSVLEREGGIILFKLRCRKFVELVLEAAAAWRKVREEEAKSEGYLNNGTSAPDEESMDIDNDSSLNGAVLNGTSAATFPPSPNKPKVKNPLPFSSPSKTPSQVALEHAIANGQSLQAHYKLDTRPEVQEIYKQTLSLVAYDDPLADDPSVPEAVKEMAGQTSRDQLAEEVNRAILGMISFPLYLICR
jgi:Ran-binding protein 9/10